MGCKPLYLLAPEYFFLGRVLSVIRKITLMNSRSWLAHHNFNFCLLSWGKYEYCPLFLLEVFQFLGCGHLSEICIPHISYLRGGREGGETPPKCKG